MSHDQASNSALVPVDAFIAASVWHGPIDESRRLLASHPEIAGANIHVAAILGDADGVARSLAADPHSATKLGGPGGWPPLLHLALSKYLHVEPARTEGFLRAATLLLDAGADPNGGVLINGEIETPLYGAAGVAHHAPLTRLLLARGADPNDVEVAYHTPESYDNDALKVLVETGRMTSSNLVMMLVRKADWHDLDGLTWLLGQGANPNGGEELPWRPLHHALHRNNNLPQIVLLLDHGADPRAIERRTQRSALSIAVRRGRADVLDLFEQRGIPLTVDGVERLILLCARNDGEAIATLRASEPNLVSELLADGATVLAEFAGTGNAEGVSNLLDLGVPVDAPYHGDGYFEIPASSTALHVAAWRGWPAVVKVLLARGAAVDARDGNQHTALQLAIRACVNSYWMVRRTPDSIRALLEAGASIAGVQYPTGYEDADFLLRGAGAS